MARVALIDDSEDIHVLLSTMLGKAGHEVRCAATADDGLALIHNWHADVVLLDVEMPVHDGAWCLRAIRAHPDLCKLPVIMVTALPVREVVVRLAQLGVDGLIIKDVNLCKHLTARLATIKPRAAVQQAHNGAAQAKAGTVTKAAPKPAPTPVVAVRPAPAAGVAADHEAHPSSPAIEIDVPEAPAEVAIDDEWDTPSLEGAAEQLRTLKPLISRNDLIEAVSSNNELRAMGPAARQVISLTGSSTSSIDAIAMAIRQDQALSLKVLKLANSTLYCNGDRVESVKKAVSRIGMAQIRSTVMAMGVLDHFATGGLAGRLRADRFWEHSITTGIIAQRIATARRVKNEEADQMFTAGLLHDIGRMLYAERLGDLYAQVIAQADRLGLPLETVESRLLLINHADMTDRLLRQWKFPSELINPIALHHLSLGNIKRMVPRGVEPVATLALANRLAHALVLGSSGNEVLYPIEEFVSALELSEAALAQIVERTPEQAFDLKTFMLASCADADESGPSSLDEARAVLGDSVVPMHVAINPSTDATAFMLARLCTVGATDTPTVAVVRVTQSTERPRLLDLLRQREQQEGASNLPTLVIGSAPSCYFQPGQLGTRAVEQMVVPARRERVLHAMVKLAGNRPAAAAA
ncbi:MAG: HDOD domain-containing protein [Phycisphaerales bacterium]|nr:HDOD domain-containing protein [Phycisphaerales bacterium]